MAGQPKTFKAQLPDEWLALLDRGRRAIKKRVVIKPDRGTFARLSVGARFNDPNERNAWGGGNPL
jgi:hypothetical protein